MNQKSIFLNQIAACHNEDGWFASFDRAVKGLTSEQASWKQTIMTNSIWEIINHLRFWNLRYFHYFTGVPTNKMQGDNDSTFRNRDQLDWPAAVESLNEIMSDWYKAIEKSDDMKLASPIHEQSDEPWADAIANLNIHNAYHIGQIVYIRKLQGSWDPEQGVH
ncbi:DinB family protein [Bacillus sp. V3-13]|uniref:DinB family protein n=1 Tax=Bacillus sp. V3-13 TaxID=2053728 RepID=UPI000C78499D|nr:DinB family protein [Bacillus sp. V3-13]PLR79267.1 DinB family protein [Bacillus sp. V3-13]